MIFFNPRNLKIKLPFYGLLSFIIRKKLHNLLKDFFPNVKFMFIFTNNFTIGSQFRHKERLPMSLISNIIYQFTCSNCKVRYIGETVRNLSLRFAEHRGVSARTNKPISSPSHSAIRSHALESDHNFSIDDFKILASVRSPLDTKLLETLFIKHLSPELNNQDTSFELNVLK